MITKAYFKCEHYYEPHDAPCGFSLEDEFDRLEKGFHGLMGTYIDFLRGLSALIVAMEAHKQGHLIAT